MILYSECKSALKCSNILSQTASAFFYFLRKRGKKLQSSNWHSRGKTTSLILLNSWCTCLIHLRHYGSPLHTICPLLKMAIFTVITMAYYLTFSQGAGFKAAREQAKCRKDSAGLGPSTAILFVSCRTRRKCSESLGRRSCSSSLLSNYFPLISGYLVYCNFVYCYTARKIWNTEKR